MIIFKDKVTGDELFSDTYKYKVIDDMYYEVDAKIVSESSDNLDAAAFGFNASAEGADAGEGVDATSTTGINIVLAHNLIETSFTKKTYMTYIKGYMKKLKDILSEDEPARVELFQKGIQPFIKEKVLANFKDYSFYTGETMNPEGMVVLVNFREDGITPFFLFIKDGILPEKV